MRRIASSMAGRSTPASAIAAMRPAPSTVRPCARQSASNGAQNARAVSSPRSSRAHPPASPAAASARLMALAGSPCVRS